MNKCKRTSYFNDINKNNVIYIPKLMGLKVLKYKNTGRNMDQFKTIIF
jgi:hypothetical protein